MSIYALCNDALYSTKLLRRDGNGVDGGRQHPVRRDDRSPLEQVQCCNGLASLPRSLETTHT